MHLVVMIGYVLLNLIKVKAVKASTFNCSNEKNGNSYGMLFEKCSFNVQLRTVRNSNYQYPFIVCFV